MAGSVAEQEQKRQSVVFADSGTASIHNLFTEETTAGSTRRCFRKCNWRNRVGSRE